MSAVDLRTQPPRGERARPPRRAEDATQAPALPWRVGLAVVLAVALGLRAWGVRHGMPYAYNADENAHFVPGAIGLFGHDLNPHYFVNPPAFTYLLHGVFAVWFGGRQGVSDAYATDPEAVFVVARLTAAVLGTIAVGLVYLTARGCSTAASGSWPRPSWRSPSCRSSTASSRSTTSPRSRRSPLAMGHGGASCAAAGRSTT
jgi:hypothetical protein